MLYRKEFEKSGARMLVRADASTQIGSGHLMRCLALAQSWQDREGSAAFVSHCESKALRQRIESAGIGFIPLERPYPDAFDLKTTLLIAGSWLVLDGYYFDPDYQRSVRAAGYRLLVIDDTAHLSYYDADVLLNQNINAEQLAYSCAPNTKLLLGTHYALIRSEFLAMRSWRREIPLRAHNVLVTLGGADPDNVTLKVVKALQQLDVSGLNARIVIGPANPHFDTLRQVLETSASGIELLTSVVDMPELMAWADVAVSAGGSTCWELAFMGLPTLVLALAENQQKNAAELEAYSVALNMGWHASVSEANLASALRELMHEAARRREMSARGRQLVDGYGAARVAGTLWEMSR